MFTHLIIDGTNGIEGHGGYLCFPCERKNLGEVVSGIMSTLLKPWLPPAETTNSITPLKAHTLEEVVEMIGHGVKMTLLILTTEQFTEIALGLKKTV